MVQPVFVTCSFQIHGQIILGLLEELLTLTLSLICLLIFVLIAFTAIIVLLVIWAIRKGNMARMRKELREIEGIRREDDRGEGSTVEAVEIIDE